MADEKLIEFRSTVLEGRENGYKVASPAVKTYVIDAALKRATAHVGQTGLSCFFF
jgi:ethanolamine utilization microcompartment shell protein EutL